MLASAPVFCTGFMDGVEQREAVLHCSAFAGLDGADDLRAVLPALDRMESARLAEALNDDFGVFVDEDAPCSFLLVVWRITIRRSPRCHR